MARPKNAVATATKSKDDKKMAAVKDGRVTKPAASAKATSKDIAASAATKVGKKDKSAKKVKEPTPVSDSSSESDDEDSASSDDSSESEVEVKPKANGHAKGVNGSATKKPAASDSEDSDSSEGDDDESDSDSEAEPAKPAAKVNGKANGKAPAKNAAAVSEDDSESDSDTDSDDGAPPVKAAAVNGADAAAKSSSEEDSDDDDSEGSDASEGDASENDSSEDEDEEAAAPAKKRKADAVEEPSSKKAKTDMPANATKNLFVGSLSWNVDDDWLQREFSEFGECTARIMTGQDGRSKGFGFVEFTTPEDAVKAHDAKKGTELDGRPMNVDYSTPRGEVADRSQRANQRADKFGDSKNNPSDTLWVGNISFGATAEMLQEAFEAYGTVTRVHLPTDQDTGALRGFGHIGMGSVDEAKAAFDAMNGAEIDGRSLRLDYATPRQENGDRGGFRGGRGGGRGGGFRGRGDFGDRGGRGGFRGRGDRGGFGGRGGGRGRGAPRGRGGTTNRGGFGDFSGQKISL